MTSEEIATAEPDEPRKSRFLREGRILLLLALPIIISQVAQIGISFTDTIMAGRHSETSLAGVAIGSSMWIPSFLFLLGIVMATTPIVAHAWGANNSADIKKSVQQAIWLGLFCGIGMLFVLQALSQVFDFVAMDAATRAQAKGYVFAVSFGLPALGVFQALRGLNEGAQQTRPYMYVSLVALLANIPLNYIFVYGKLGFEEMGGVGCGWATALVLWLECLLMFLVTLFNRKLSHITWHKNWHAPEQHKIMEILRLGIPIGIALLIESSMFALIALFLGVLGSTVVAGHQVAMSFASLLFMIPLSLSLALTIRCGFYLGQGQTRNARYVGFMGIGTTVITAALFSTLILLAAEQIAAMYTTNPDVQSLAVKLLLLAAFFQFSDAIQVAAAGVLRGYKDTRFAFFVVLVAYWGVGLPLGYSLGLTEIWGSAHGAAGFWLGLIAGLSLACVLLAGRFVILSKRTLSLRV